MNITLELTQKTQYTLFYPAIGEWFAASQTGAYRAHPNTTNDITKAKFWDFEKLAINAEVKDTRFKKMAVEAGNPDTPKMRAGIVKKVIVSAKYEEEAKS